MRSRCQEPGFVGQVVSLLGLPPPCPGVHDGTGARCQMPLSPARPRIAGGPLNRALPPPDGSLPPSKSQMGGSAVIFTGKYGNGVWLPYSAKANVGRYNFPRLLLVILSYDTKLWLKSKLWFLV